MYRIPLLFCIAAVFPFILLRVSDRFYQIIGNLHPSRFLGLILFSLVMVCCAVVALAEKLQRRRRAFQFFSALLWGIFLLSAVELIGARFIEPYTSPAGWRAPDPTLRFRYKSYVQWTGWMLGDQTHWDRRERRYVEYLNDKNGFRNPDDLQSADVVCIGDSFTVAGSTAGQTYPAVLSQLTGYSVANLGRGGYSAQQELEVLRRYGMPLQPRILVWQFFEGNDLNESLAYENWRGGKTEPTFRRARLRLIRVTKTALNRSVVFNTFRRWLMPSKMQFGYKSAGDADTILRHRGWKPIESTLAEGVELAQKHQIRTVLLFFPCKASVYKPNSKRPGMAVLLEQFAQNHALDFINMWEIYRARYLQSGEIYYWFNDSHISNDGGRLAAEVVAGVIGGRLR